MNAFGEPRSVLLLGGTSEIGLATVRLLAERGARRIVLAGRDLDTLRSEAARLPASAQVEVEPLDAAETGGHGPLLDKLFAHDDIDLAIVAFGVLGDQASIEEDPDLGVELARVNYVGTVSVGLHLARHIRRQGHGAVVLLSSAAGLRPRRANYVYGSSKAGVDAFGRGLAEALRGSGGRVLVVRPGFVRTKMTAGMASAPLAADADGVAAAILRGLSRGQEIVWVPAALRAVMTVLRALPAVLFRRIQR